MAEAWTRHLHGERFEVYSAGTRPGVLDERAVRVMGEAGVGMSGHRSKSVDEVAGVDVDCVITVCDSARESCPVLPGNTRHLHAGFEDPPRLAAGASSEEEALAPYRQVRDEIREFVRELPGSLEGQAAGKEGPS
jgi:arsenate reductase